MLSRRECLQIGATGVGAAALAATSLVGCAPVAARFARRPEPLPLPEGETSLEARILGRTTFGARPGDVARLRKAGRATYNDWLLAAKESEDPRLLAQLYRLDVLRLDSSDLFDLRMEEVDRQLQVAGLLHAVYGANPFLERMVDFWSNHFNIYAAKADGTFRKSVQEQRILRKHALGNFTEMLSGMAHSPAMLAYLDNDQNRKGHPNENYARELLELHSLGVGGGYSQADVQEVARCFTGWGIEKRFMRPRGQFRFELENHDEGTKRVLGKVVPPNGGKEDGDVVLALVAVHPQTGRHLATKLCKYFLGRVPDGLLQKMADSFVASKGDIKALVRPLLESDDLISPEPVLKRPLHFLASALRAVEADTDGGGDLQAHLTAMGQPFYKWPMPDGYPTKVEAWTGNLLPRWNFAQALSADKIRGTSIRTKDADWFELTHGRRPGDQDGAIKDLLAESTGKDGLAMCLCAPSFQWT